MSPKPRPFVFGEVLFDRFPDGAEVLGGAPFNVAWHLQAMGQAPLLVTRVGDDDAGRRVSAAMTSWGMDTAGLQVDPDLPTGRVTVSIDEGEPDYTIEHPAAWDAIATPAPGGRPGLLYHGSLALRETASRKALSALLGRDPGCVFVDVNLRSPWWTERDVLALLATAHWVKLNEVEMGALSGDSLADPSGFVAQHGLRGLVLTRGAEGAEIHLADGTMLRARPVRTGAFVDAVGAGDALAAVVLCGLLEDWPIEVTLERAQQLASRICARRGATADSVTFYRPLLREWNMEGD